MTSSSRTPAVVSRAPERPGGEIRQLTGLRIVAAVWVVLFHYSWTAGHAYEAVSTPLRPVLQAGPLGVDLFFVLSGYVITMTYLQAMGPRFEPRRAVRFWWARICRLWPVYAVVTTLFGLWLVLKASHGGDGPVAYQPVQPVVDVRHWVEQLFLVQLWHRPIYDGSSWVGPAWSLSAEWLAYVVFPVLVLVLWRLRNLPPAVTGAVAVLCMAPSAWLCYRTGSPYYAFSWVERIGAGFTAGAFTYLTVRRLRVTPVLQRRATVVAVLALAEVLVGLWWGSWRGQGTAEFGGVVVVLFPVLVGSLAVSPHGLSRLLSTGPMVHGGRISFSLYLVHVPMIEVFWTLMGWFPRIGADTAVGSLLIPHVLLGFLVVAHLCHRYVEEPARLRLRDLGPGRRRPAPRDATVVLDLVPGQRPRPSASAAPAPRELAEQRGA